MSQLELPQEFATYLESRTKSNGSGGRPTFVQRIAKEGNALDEILIITEKAWMQNHSCRSIADYYKRRGYTCGVATIFRILQDLEPFKLLLVKYLETTPRRKRFYNSELDSSDYETVSNYIKRAKRDDLRNYRRNVKTARRCWKALGYKNPQNWKAEEVLSFIATLKKGAQSTMLDAIRVIAPQLADKSSLEYIGTGRFREKIGRRKKDIFGNEVKLIIDALDKLPYEQTIFLLHITTGAREGKGKDESGLCGLTWDRFKKNFKRVDLFESKVRGGIWCRDCPVDLLFPHLHERLRKLWKERGKPTTAKVIVGGYKELLAIYTRIRETLKDKYDGKLDPSLYQELTTLRPHDSDKIHCNLLWEAKVPLEVVAGQYLGQGEGIGLMGRIWLDINTIKKHYLSLTARSERFQEIRSQVTEYSKRFNGGS